MVHTIDLAATPAYAERQPETVQTVEQTRTIEIGTLRRAGYVGKVPRNWWNWRNKAYAMGIQPVHWGEGYVELRRQTLRTVQVPWRFSGKRFYFLCECGRTAEKLHTFSDLPWRCRHCYNLTYAVRQAVPRHRHILMAQKIREQLGGSPSMLDAFPPKPKGMHRRRYERLRRRHDAATQRAFGMMSAYFAGLRGKR
jgi:hypothetical protein